MDIAQKVEDLNWMIKRARGPTAQRNQKFSPATIKPNPFPMKTVMMEGKFSNDRRDEPVRRMSDAKWKMRRDKGLCFRCIEKYTAGHQCKN